MSTVAPRNDAKSAHGTHLLPPGLQVLPAGSFKVEKVVSLDDFKAKMIGMGGLRPAVLKGSTLWVQGARSQQ
jgi:hypothetical protein